MARDGDRRGKSGGGSDEGRSGSEGIGDEAEGESEGDKKGLRKGWCVHIRFSYIPPFVLDRLLTGLPCGYLSSYSSIA